MQKEGKSQREATTSLIIKKSLSRGIDGGEGGIRTHGSQRLHTLSRRA